MKPALSRKRRWIRLGAAAFAVVLLAGGGLGWAWRHGVGPLPAPVPGIAVALDPAPTWDQVGPDNGWYWSRELARRLPASPRSRMLDQAVYGVVDGWARSGAAPSAPQEAIIRGILTDPGYARCLAGWLAAGDTRQPQPREAEAVRATFLLASWPLLQAGDAERRGLRVEALRHLVAAWTMQAQLQGTWVNLILFDERGAEQVYDNLVRPWRRLVVTGPPLERGAGRQLLAALEAVTNTLPPLSESYRRVLADVLVDPRRTEPLPWRRVRFAFSQAMTLMLQDGFDAVGLVFSTLLGSDLRGRRVEGIQHWGRPVRLLAEALQERVARRDDLAAAEAGAASQALAALAAGRTATGPAGQPPTGLRSWLDRPAAWRAVASLPSPQVLVQARQRWTVYLEACRVVLATRLFQAERGRWPDRLEELVPAILPALPTDPVTGEGWTYRREGDGRWLRFPVPGTLEARELSFGEG